MKSKLKEGQVVKCTYFGRGYVQNSIVRVGDYADNYLNETYSNTGNYVSGGIPSIDENRGKKEFLVLEVKEQQPEMTIGNRTSSYENQIRAIELNEDGTYDENNQEISFSTCYVYKGSIKEENVEIIGEMKKTYIKID